MRLTLALATAALAGWCAAFAFIAWSLGRKPAVLDRDALEPDFS